MVVFSTNLSALYTGNKKKKKLYVYYLLKLELGLIYVEPFSELDSERIKYMEKLEAITESPGRFLSKEVLFTRVIVMEEMSLSDTSLLLMIRDCAA